MDNILEQLIEVDKRLKNSTSWKNNNDLMKYKKRLLKELKKNRHSR